MHQDSIITTALVLRSTDVKDHDRITLLFSREMGLVRVYVSGSRTRNQQGAVASNPLVESEWVLKAGREDLYFFQEASVITQNLHLRSNYNALQAACDMVKATEKALVDGDPAPEMYQLLGLFLKNLPQAKSPSTIRAIYQLKTLLYQGLIGESDPEALVELSGIRSLEALMSLELPDNIIEHIQEIFQDRLLFHSME